MGSISIGDEYVAALRMGDSNSFPDTDVGVDADVDIADVNAAAVDSAAFEKKQVAIR